MLPTIDSTLFNALQNIDVEQMFGKDVSCVLPFLSKLVLNPSFLKRHELLKLLYPIRKMNDVIALLLSRNIDSHESSNLQISDFESCSGADRLKIVTTEYIRLQDRARSTNYASNANAKLLTSELFDNPIYVDDISYCLCALLMKPTTIPVVNVLDMSEALLHLKYGPTYIIRIVANLPDRCQEVCHSLITYGERQDEGANFNEVSEQRAKTLRMLCLMNPSIAFTIRAITLQMCKIPSLTIMITLDHLTSALEKYNAIYERVSDNSISSDVMDTKDSKELSQAFHELEDSYDNAIAFVTGILLGVDEATRVWFAQYTKSAQQKRIDQSHYSVLSKFRSQILEYMNRLFPALLEDDYRIDNNTSDDTEEDSKSTPKSKLDPRNLNQILIRATATLRLFCALRGIGSLKLNPEESEILLRLIICKPPANQTSVNFATTGVCTLLACAAVINNQKDERRAADWLKWLIKESNYSDSSFSSHGKCSISELLLLIAIHFQNNQNNQIAELVCATIGMHLQIKASVSKCKSLFVQEVFNDQMVAEHAVRVPVTKNLNDNIKEFLPVHCIHQLLESRSFSKHQVPIKDWIYRQICESKKPIHHILPKLIEAYVNSVIISSSIHGHCGTNQPLPEDEIARIFEIKLYSVGKSVDKVCLENGAEDSNRPTRRKTKKEKLMESKIGDEVDKIDDREVPELDIVDVEASQVLLLYYLVLYEDIRLKKYSELSPAERTKVIKYSPELMMDIPIFYLLQLVRDNQNSFSTILPDLLKLVTSQYPQLCSIQHWLNIEHYTPHTLATDDYVISSLKDMTGDSSIRFTSKVRSPIKSVKTIKGSILKQLVDGFKNVEKQGGALPLAKIVTQIIALPREEIWPYVNVFTENMSKILNLNVSNSPEYKKLIGVTTKLWWKFNAVFPRKLWVMTVNSLKRPQDVKQAIDVKSVEYSWNELALDPLIVLRCDSRVYRCVETLNIVLHILSAFLAASRRCLQDQINEQPGRQKDVRNLEELRTTLILAQTSAAIQILLEFCMPSEDEQEALDKRESMVSLNEEESLILDRFDSSVNCICEHLHQVFIADTNLAKLVHFQTYPSELLATTSNKIPSMHICLDFIPELLSQPDLSKQVFVVQLTSHLCEKYAITKSLNVAKLCFNVAFTLLQLLPSVRRALFFIPVLPALMRICKVFPILREDADIILSQISQITLTHMASTSSRLSLGSSRPFEGLERMSWTEIRKLISTLSLQEALYLSIQKCSLDLDKLKESNKNDPCFEHQQPIQPVYNTIFAYGNHVINPSGG